MSTILFDNLWEVYSTLKIILEKLHDTAEEITKELLHKIIQVAKPGATKQQLNEALKFL